MMCFCFLKSNSNKDLLEATNDIPLFNFDGQTFEVKVVDIYDGDTFTGCFKFKVGDAEISKKHCNFFVNNGNASSADIENLINRVKQTIIEKTGINLELEIKIVGE